MNKTVFNQIVDYIKACADTKIKGSYGETEEVGMAINNDICITTNMENDRLFIHYDGKECLKVLKDGGEFALYALKELFSDMAEEEKSIGTQVNSVADIEKVLYKQVELLAENSKECEPSELVEITKCITNVLYIIQTNCY